MKLSHLGVGEMGRVSPDGEEFIVTNRDAEDRSSGSTRVRYLSGGTEVFLWDYDNPVVLSTGKGRLETRIIRE